MKVTSIFSKHRLSRTLHNQRCMGKCFSSMGIDSLMALELRNRLESSLGLSLPATLVWSYPTINALVPHLAGKMGLSLEPEEQANTHTAAEQQETVLEELGQLSDEEMAALLAEELTAAQQRKAK